MTVFKRVSPNITLGGSGNANVNTPDVSVIIAAYNSGAFVENAINSALNQVGVSVEVVVVDDASSDDTANVVAAVKDSRVSLLRHKQNQWAGSARNTAISHARGKWLAILDSDDEFESNRLIKLKTLAEQTNCQLVCDNILICDHNGESVKPMFSADKLSSIRRMSLTDFIAGNMGGAKGYSLGYFKPFIQRAFLEQHNIRYPTNMNLGEDYFILADLLASGANCVVEPEPYYRYTVRFGSMSQRLQVRDTDNILRESKAFEQRHALDGEVLSALKKRRSYVVLNRAFLRAIESIKAGKVLDFIYILIGHPKIIVLLLRSATNKTR